MRSNSGLIRISTALAVALALVPLLASGSAAAATSKPTDVPPVDRPIDVIDSDEIGDPVDRPIDVIDSDEIGDPVAGPDNDDPELPARSEQRESVPSGSGGDGSSTSSEGSGGVPASVRDVPLARTGFPVLVLTSLGGLSLVTGLRLLGLRRV